MWLEGQHLPPVLTEFQTIRVSSAAASNIWNLVGADPNDGSYSDCSVNGDPITIVAASGNTFDIPASM